MNYLYHADNLSILREIPDASVDLIATDPPFNTGKDWGAFDDRWEGGLKGYLKFMEARLEECRRVLKDTGSLYLHCNYHTSHYLKVMLDTLFGMDNFRNEIIWSFRKAPSNKYDFQRSHAIIFRYSKTDVIIWNQLRERYADSTIQRFGNVKLKHIRNAKGKLQPKKSTEKSNGAPMRDVWDTNLLSGHAKENTKYPTQKPIALYSRMIQASSNQGGIVLDPFAGSGTTLDAAQTLGRRWIGIDQSDEAIKTIQKRLEQRHGLLIEYEIIN